MDRPYEKVYGLSMPSLTVKKSSSLSPEESFDRVSQLLQNDSELKKLDAKYTCNFDKGSLSGQAAGSQFKAKMQIHKTASGSDVEVAVDLPFHLALVKGMVQKTLEKKLDQALG